MNSKQIAKLILALSDEEVDTATSSEPSFPEKVFIRTVTHYHVGRVVSVTDKWIILDEASWVASTGRFNQALVTGSLDEVEPFTEKVWVSLAAIIDVTEWNHSLPRTVK